jgi:HEPN domain-containing protein
MERSEAIRFWRESSDNDWEVVISLFQNNHFMHCLFFAHLSIEKLLKAH